MRRANACRKTPPVEALQRHEGEKLVFSFGAKSGPSATGIKLNAPKPTANPLKENASKRPGRPNVFKQTATSASLTTAQKSTEGSRTSQMSSAVFSLSCTSKIDSFHPVGSGRPRLWMDRRPLSFSVHMSL
ncbi:hypothetical protein OF83DRAFT_1160762 [Amylostereum chailletii]|nr:hypothetical protein OF83DRAFT_1160762 [Amylostereum chailletii]